MVYFEELVYSQTLVCDWLCSSYPVVYPKFVYPATFDVKCRDKFLSHGKCPSRWPVLINLGL